MFWVATRRIHHQFSDKDGDPHARRDGKWWSHIAWMLIGDGTHCNIEQCSRYAPDICEDRFLIWLSKYHYVPLVILAILLLGLGPAISSVESVLPRDDGAAHYVDGQFSNALLGNPAISYSRRLTE